MEMKRVKRIGLAVLMVLLLSVVGLLFYYTLWLITDDDFRQELKNGWPWQSWQMLVDYAATCLFTSVVTFYYWRSRERAERERDKFRLQALENQLSPHFVFNNFSILADLIEVDPKRASTYLMNLSKVYRYTLSHLNHDTVTLQEELEFLDRYVALLQQRFGKGIQVDIRADVALRQGLLPPAALQVLIENAIKHNEHTAARPLHIVLTSDQGHVSVSNHKQPIPEPESTKVGLHNIVERYRLLTSQKVVVSDTQDDFCVTIPLITT